MQSKQRQLLVPWLVLTPFAYGLPFLCDHWQTYKSMVGHDSNRWIHFLIFAVLAAIPATVFRRKKDVLTSYIVIVPAVLIEIFHCSASNISADLFGTASGFLLGLNLHLMNAGSGLTHHEQAQNRDSV